MEKKWITTEQMLEALRQRPDTVQLYEHRLGTWLSSEHCLEYNSKKNNYGDSTAVEDWDWYTEAQFLENHSGEWWRIVV